jgi:hypothetical protein
MPWNGLGFGESNQVGEARAVHQGEVSSREALHAMPATKLFGTKYRSRRF